MAAGMAEQGEVESEVNIVRDDALQRVLKAAYSWCWVPAEVLELGKHFCSQLPQHNSRLT